MYLNTFADSTDPLDMADSDEFASLLTSASDLGIPHSPDVRYQSNNLVVRHQRFHYLEWGDPDDPPVLLLHGGNQSAHSWDLVSLHLADRHRVIAPDQRGHGDSEWARDADYSSTAMALDAAAFIGTLGLGRPIVIGHSMGGLNALRLVTEHPELVSALVLVDVGPELSADGTKVVREFVTHNREFDDLEQFVENVRKYDPYRPRTHIERTVKYNMLLRADGKYVSKCDRGPHLQSTREYQSTRDRMGLADVTGIEQPVLVIRGEHSTILTPELAERFVDALPDGRLTTVAASGHNVHGQNTPGFIEAVGPFLAEVAAAG